MTGAAVPAIHLRDLALLSDRRTAALTTRLGEIVWYSPERFDAPSLLGKLLDTERGGSWRIEAPNLQAGPRQYLGDSGVLETRLMVDGGELHVTDFLPFGPELPRGLCRRLSASPSPYSLILSAAPDYARQAAAPRLVDGQAVIAGKYHLCGSHPLSVEGERVRMAVPAGEEAWALLGLDAVNAPTAEDAHCWQQLSLQAWQDLTREAVYYGPYQEAVRHSLRTLRMLTDHDGGGTIAAPTTSLPEVLGGQLNWDYRYVWLRDAGMVISVLTRMPGDGNEARRFLDFISAAAPRTGDLPLTPFLTVDGHDPPEEQELPLAGYAGSLPVQVGNGARDQLQLDAYGNVLLAAKLLYQRFGSREHWAMIETLTDFLAFHWQDDDFGIWEERQKQPYVAGKVLTACALEYLAPLTKDAAQAQRWRSAAKSARAWVAEHGLTSEGAYAYIAGKDGVDISAALYPVWGYCQPDSPEMLATVRVLERDYCQQNLYWRHLDNAPSPPEGAFLAGTFWMAQYWVMRGPQQARVILDAALKFASDLGQLSEEADVESGELLGNFPQTFVHAALIGAVFDLKVAEAK